MNASSASGCAAPLRVLHVASFTGNIGDNANHLGFRSWFTALVPRSIEWREFEIRRVFWRDAAFDDAFVSLANDCDLLVIGGGNFFELWVKDSPSGTSISITNERLRQIRVPILVHGLGVDIHQGVAPGNVERFRAFLQTLRECDGLITVRNDGAVPNLREIGIEPAEFDILELPDGGFFARFATDAGKRQQRKIGINIAGDMLEQRFSGAGGTLGYPAFIERLAAFIIGVTDRYPDLSVILFPHIFRDLRVYCDLLDALPDWVRRGRVEVARYGAGDGAASLIFGEYALCTLVLGMRFHANVVPLAHQVPTIGLNTYMQIENLYEGLGLRELLVDVRREGFETKLRELVDSILTDATSARVDQAAVDQIDAGLGEPRERIRAWLNRRLVVNGRGAEG